MNKYLTTTEVANKTGLSDRAVRRRIENARQGTNGETINAVRITDVSTGRSFYGVSPEALKEFRTGRR